MQELNKTKKGGNVSIGSLFYAGVKGSLVGLVDTFTGIATKRLPMETQSAIKGGVTGRRFCRNYLFQRHPGLYFFLAIDKIFRGLFTWPNQDDQMNRPKSVKIVVYGHAYHPSIMPCLSPWIPWMCAHIQCIFSVKFTH